MLSLRDVHKIQADYNVTFSKSNMDSEKFASYLGACRTFVTDNQPENYSSLDGSAKTTVTLELIALFIDKHPKNVEGYTSSDGVLKELLLQDLYDEISGEGIIKDALNDPEVDEIQINDDSTIFVVRGGKTEYFVDNNGRIRKFASCTEVETLLAKLIDDKKGNTPQFTEGNPILNAKTAVKQYRVNAVHSSLVTSRPAPFGKPTITAVIRKFKENHLTIDDLVTSGAVNEQMARFLMLLGRASLNIFCVGATGSGKTTLLRIIASTISTSKRIILVQNPTEISFFETDEYGRMIRNCLHWEVDQSAKPSNPNSGTMANLISNSLRETPDVLLVGEAREPAEFSQLYRAMMTGHTTLGTFHAGDAKGAIYRFADEIKGDGSITEAMSSVGNQVNIIIAQARYDDGTRRVTGITEVCGTDDTGKVILSPLFTYEESGEIEVDENGVSHILGSFKQENPISESLQKKFYRGGVSKEELKEFVEVTK